MISMKRFTLVYNNTMNFQEYQAQARETALYPQVGQNLLYPTLGLAGEAGEFANKVKKIQRDVAGEMSEEIRQSLVEELGDVLWYVSQLSSEIGATLEQVAERNIEKLASRKVREALHGSGDHR